MVAPSSKAPNDDRVDTSDIVHGSHVLGAFPYGDDAWNSVVSCVKDTFSSFNVQVTDVDPGTASHFEIMIGGLPADLGFPTNVGGVSPNGCGQTYIPNALVFDFANVWSRARRRAAGCIEDICSTAAQEIAHSFALDHSTNAADPMTYFDYTGAGTSRTKRIRAAATASTASARWATRAAAPTTRSTRAA